MFCNKWGDSASWKNVSEVQAPHEANFLKLDCSKIKSVFNWTPSWHIDRAVEMVCEWSKVYLTKGDIELTMSKQIKEYLSV